MWCLSLGVPMDFRMRYGDFGDAAKLIQVDMDASEIGRNRAVDVGIVANAHCGDRAVDRRAIGTIAARQEFGDWVAQLQGVQEEKRTDQAEWENSDGTADSSIASGARIEQGAGRGHHHRRRWGRCGRARGQSVDDHQTGAVDEPGPLGCLGVGLPFALAAQALYPNKKVIVLNGDGSFGLNGMEFDTAVRFGLPIVTVIGNDGQWGEIRLPQIALMGEERAVATQLAPNVHYEQNRRSVRRLWRICDRPERNCARDSNAAFAHAENRPL